MHCVPLYPVSDASIAAWQSINAGGVRKPHIMIWVSHNDTGGCKRESFHSSMMVVITNNACGDSCTTAVKYKNPAKLRSTTELCSNGGKTIQKSSKSAVNNRMM